MKIVHKLFQPPYIETEKGDVVECYFCHKPCVVGGECPWCHKPAPGVPAYRETG